MRDEYDFSHAQVGKYADRVGKGPPSTPVTRGEQPSSGTVELYRDANGAYRWRIKTTDGRVLAISPEGYPTAQACRKATDTLIQAMAQPVTVTAA